MNRKYLIISLLAIFIIVSAGIAFASDDDTVTINGLEFNIPDGYHESNSLSSMVFLENDNGDECSIEVTPALSDEISMAGISNTIAGKEGAYTPLISEDGDEKVQFTYMEDSYMITILAPDEDTVAAIIGE